MTHVSDGVCVLGLERIHVFHGIVSKERWPGDTDRKSKPTTRAWTATGDAYEPRIKISPFRGSLEPLKTKFGGFALTFTAALIFRFIFAPRFKDILTDSYLGCKSLRKEHPGS